MEEDHFAAFPSFRSFFTAPWRYYRLLNYPDSELLELIKACLEASSDPESEVCAMLSMGWREQIVGAMAMLCGAVTPRTVGSLWQALDRDSWAIPQLAVVVAALDPEAPREMRKRLLLGCPVLADPARQAMSPMERHVAHGGAALPRYSLKAWTAYCWRVGIEAEGMRWLLERFSADQAFQRLLALYGYEGCNIANDWHKQLCQARPDLDLPPALETDNACKYLAQHWCTPEGLAGFDCPKGTLEALLADYPQVSDILEPLLAPGLAAGDDELRIRADGVKSRHHRLPLSPGIRGIIVARLAFGLDDGKKRVSASGNLPELTMTLDDDALVVRLAAPPRELDGRINLCRDRLENARTEAICYGAKDTGEMGGGAAIAVYQACGPELLEALREGLAKSTRAVGEVVVTPAFRHADASFVGHLISIKTNTARGDWCPTPEDLGRGVYTALDLFSQKRVRTVAFSCLATGEGRAEPARIATLMLGAAKKFFKDHPDSSLKVLFCLPSYRDYQAFEKVLAAQ